MLALVARARFRLCFTRDDDLDHEKDQDYPAMLFLHQKRISPAQAVALRRKH